MEEAASMALKITSKTIQIYSQNVVTQCLGEHLTMCILHMQGHVEEQYYIKRFISMN